MRNRLSAWRRSLKNEKNKSAGSRSKGLLLLCTRPHREICRSHDMRAAQRAGWNFLLKENGI